MNTYLLDFENIKDLTVAELSNLIKTTPGIPLKQLKVYDLSYCDGQKILPGIGVYVFKVGERIIYVGKCSSSSFVERIPKHFDARKGAWFHRLLELVAKEILASNKIDENTLIKASDYAFDNLSLILINFQNNKRRHINSLEKLLRISLNPINCSKRKIQIADNLNVSKYLRLRKPKISQLPTRTMSFVYHGF